MLLSTKTISKDISPARPLMPGVLIVEAMAQVGGIVLTQMSSVEGGLFVFAGIDKVRFRRQVVPGIN